ncbi:MAG: hypothetical protein IPK16_00840 [Anaerolineales bacterium]|nr:hypothetical protein [Anaerolineales bacterium]
MNRPICQHLATLDTADRRATPVDFPSFENVCLAAGAPELILLGDQATYCLSGGCTNCPRFTAAEHMQPAGAFVPLYGSAEDAWQVKSRSAAGPAADGFGFIEDQPSASRRWAWLGAGLIFLSVFACGTMVAVYSGWQWATRTLPNPAALGRVDTLTDAPNTRGPEVYLVLTATPPAVALAAPPTAQIITGASLPALAAPALPSAVTPTPLVVRPRPTGPIEDGVPPAAPGTATTDPSLVDVGLLVPTRRPTPEFDLPTSTPLADLPTATQTATPVPLGTPVVVFGPDAKELKKDGCTLVRWAVQNVRAVYYENLAMTGEGQKEECISNHDETYTLMVVLDNGQSQIYTTTVLYLPPTPTITPTPSFTPEPVYTPTWTPIAPTSTPAKQVAYGVSLSANGATSITCTAGQTCEIGLLLTNSGTDTDNLSASVMEGGPFSIQICRLDSVCDKNNLTIYNVGPGNTAFVNARVSVPGDATAGQSASYNLQGFSEGSGRNVSSGVLGISVTAP